MEKCRVRRNKLIINGTLNVNLLLKYDYQYIDTLKMYGKSWSIKDLDGSDYKITCSIRQYEDSCFVFINNVWLGSAITINKIEKIVKTIKLMN